MIGFLLVHSPLVGPLTWSRVAEELRRWGYGVATPSLAGCTQPYWRSHVARVIEAAAAFDDGPLVVVGHSGAGPLLPLVADALGGHVEGCIYVDAMLPTGGGSRIEHLPIEFAAELRASAVDGLAPPWGDSWPAALWAQLVPDDRLRAAFRAELRPWPLAMYAEPVPEPAVNVRNAYLQFSDAYTDEAAGAVARGWAIRRMAGGHLHMLLDPAGVADVLVGLADRL